MRAMKGLDQARFDIPEGVRDRPHGGGAGAGASARLGAWGRAIVEMRGMDSERLPTRKLDRLLAAVAAVCDTAAAQARASAEGSGGAPSATSALGADDLLPVLAFLVVKSNLACAALTSLTIYSVCDLKGPSFFLLFTLFLLFSHLYSLSAGVRPRKGRRRIITRSSTAQLPSSRSSFLTPLRRSYHEVAPQPGRRECECSGENAHVLLPRGS